jgi:1-acyl-sn-glycerol-3-phosphate acyltransferase
VIRALDHQRRAPGLGFWRTVWWDMCRFPCHLAYTMLWDLRVEGAQHIPVEGPAIVVANHQSFLDPPAHGIALRDRPFRPLARASLFRSRIGGPWLRSVGVIPLKDDGGDAAAIREALDALRRGRILLIYPEGSRSEDGAMMPFESGVSLVVRRAKVPVVPAAIEGAFDAFPRGAALPRPGPISVRFGPAIPADEAARLFRDPRAGLAALHERVDALRLQCRADLRRRTGGRLPRPGPGDRPYEGPRVRDAGGSRE